MAHNRTMSDASTPDRSQQDGAQRLLDKALQHVREHGYEEMSLRAMAQLLGTSHRMLIYYFGSSEGFWRAIMLKLRHIQTEGLLALMDTEGGPTFEQAWAYLSSPEQRPFFRSLFQIYGRVLGEPQGQEALLYELADQWLIHAAAQLVEHLGMTPEEGRVQARLRMAVIRGLMLDLLSTHDEVGVQEAVALFARVLPLPAPVSKH